MEFTLAARPPFSLATAVNAHGWVQLAPFTGPDDDHGFDYVLELSTGQIVAFHVGPTATGVQVLLETALADAEQVEKAFAGWDQWQGLAYWFWDWAYHHE